jgi:catechol 2,3-dioxygenase-like lactoylglutathione lyase family enzyme
LFTAGRGRERQEGAAVVAPPALTLAARGSLAGFCPPRKTLMTQAIAHVALVVRDYDEAIAFYTGVMGFELAQDTPLGGGKRWVVVRPAGSSGTSLLLARAATPEQESRVGDQAGGRVFLFLHTDDFQRDYDTLTSRGVRFVEGPRREAYGTVAVFLDLYGNKWDLVERSTAAGGR